MANKKFKELENEGNGQGVPGIQELLQAIAHNQQELSDRLSDIEEATSKKDDSATIVKLANMYFKPEDKYLPDLSWISPLAARPLAEAMALDEMTSPKVRSGEISLNRLVIENWLHFQRGVRGRLLGIGADAMREQISGEAAKGEENMPDFEAGKE
jgi:hypothetical protein